ncbi:MAG: hypothetical protein LC115_12905 [Bacteroidia bacterium]|nr:hypothetical protein [Bacteroidia bacterium]
MEQKQTLYWLVPKITPRISYLAQTLFASWSSVEIIPATSPETNSRILNSTHQEYPNQIQLPELSPVLFESGETKHLPELLPNLADKNPDSFDWFSVSFWLLTEYVNYVKPSYDKFERYDFKAIEHTGFYQKPYIDLWVNYLAEKIHLKWPEIQIQKPLFKQEITCDIDHLFAFRKRGFLNLSKKFLAAIFQQDIERIQLLLKYLYTGQDPYEVSWEILFKINPETLRFFVLLSNKHPRDSFYSPDFQPLIQKIRDLSLRGYSVGIHPSYNTIDGSYIKDEYLQLQNILNKEVTNSRQHYLRYRLPATYRTLISVGIREEFTACLPTVIGYKYSTSRPFFWYDIQKEETTSLQIHPTIAMDRTLLEDMARTPQQAKEDLLKLRTDIQEVGGVFRLLIHPETLSNFFEWKDWRDVFVATQIYS